MDVVLSYLHSPTKIWSAHHWATPKEKPPHYSLVLSATLCMLYSLLTITLHWCMVNDSQRYNEHFLVLSKLQGVQFSLLHGSCCCVDHKIKWDIVLPPIPPRPAKYLYGNRSITRIMIIINQARTSTTEVHGTILFVRIRLWSPGVNTSVKCQNVTIYRR